MEGHKSHLRKLGEFSLLKLDKRVGSSLSVTYAAIDDGGLQNNFSTHAPGMQPSYSRHLFPPPNMYPKYLLAQNWLKNSISIVCNLCRN